jgi:4-hydroxybenzoate polyprenyltransferase
LLAAAATTAAAASLPNTAYAATATQAKDTMNPTALYRSSARAQLAALREPDAGRVRAAVGAGIHALLPLQASLVSRAGGAWLAVLIAAGLPQAGRLARKVSPT